MAKKTRQYLVRIKTTWTRAELKDFLRSAIARANDSSYRGCYWTPPVQDCKVRRRRKP